MAVSGIFYDREERRLRAVRGSAHPGWTLVTHNMEAGPHLCRRIMREWVPPDEVLAIDFTGLGERLAG